MKYTLKITASLAFLLLSLMAGAQEVWSLERCVRYAQENNLTIKQAVANVKTSVLSERQAKTARLPNVSANFNAGEQFGYTIDPTTNSFNTQATGFNSIGLNANISLFNGGLIHHSVKQSGWDRRAAEADAEQSINNISLQVAAAYLNILLYEEQAQNANRRVSLSQQQLSVTQKMIDAGTVPMVDKYNIEAQIARDQQSAVLSQNNIDLAYLNLKQLLQLEPDYELRIEKPVVPIPEDAQPEALTLSPVYQTALGTQPSVRAADHRVESAREGIAIAKSAYYPSVGFGVNLNSNYSTAFKAPERVDVFPYILPVLIDGESRILEVPGQEIQIPVNVQRVPYFEQMNQNFGQSVGLSISIPIYQNGRTRLSVERANLALLNAQLQQNQTRQTLKNDIQTAIANARAADKQYEAAQRTLNSTSLAFENMEKRYTVGAVNAFDLTTAKNNRDNAENDMVVAKYDFLFKLKILDFYLGKPLNMN
ncbi:MAG: TolC family protein [Saprospiraceae bacterium]|nr:TolC family protein [Saprospiraceae bacterium]